MSKLQIIGIIIVIALIGIFDLSKLFYNKKKMLNFAIDYLNKFREFSNAYLDNNFDSNLYEWLIYNSTKIQTQLGSYGVLAYRPAFENYMFNNYPIILNTLPKMRNGRIDNQEIMAVDDCLMRYIGMSKDIINSSHKDLRNPFIWLRIGIQYILTLPLQIFYWFGILSHSLLIKIKDNTFIKIISVIIIIIGLIGSIVTITLGWQQFTRIIQSIIK
jgi:hypothetical protein